MKSLVPTHPHLRTKVQRRQRAKHWLVQQDALPKDKRLKVERVEVCIGSRRKNVKGVKLENIEQVFHETTWFSIVGLRDGRVVFLDGRRVRPESGCTDATVSHDLENLWWYGVDQPAREAFTTQIAKATA